MFDALEIERRLVAHIADELGISPQSVSRDKPLTQMGLTSAQAIGLSGELSELLGRNLPPSIAYDYPTVAALAAYLAEPVFGSGPEVADCLETALREDDIAVIGMGCRFPGGVHDPESFWRLLEEGRDTIAPVPASRWDVDALYDADPDAAGKMTTRFGAFLSDIDQFDPSFFGVSPREAEKMDPQQRLVLETSWEALEHAGLAPDGLMGSDTGVFVGLAYQEYGRAAADDLAQLDGHVVTGSSGSVASGRVSYLLGLEGPSLTVDTACSSSLVTVHLACQSLRRGECSLALAGGVTVMLTPTIFVEFSRLRGLAADGKCKSFSAAADGVSWGEGCGMVVLKRLDSAQRDGDAILAVIRGSAVNQDGRSNGLTAPNGPSQQSLIRRALAEARISPSAVSYVECHGTGTALGDPIEVQALGAVMGKGRPLDQPVLIGSVKSNIAHTQAAAGVAGLMKVVLALQHERIPKNLHFDAPSPHIAWEELPVRVAKEAVVWKRNGQPRRAGVSSFGLSGTNAHVVLEEGPEPPKTAGAPERGLELFVISGQTEGGANAQAARLAAHLARHPEQALGDIAYSLATTRTALDSRVGVVAGTREELSCALATVAKGETPPGALRGRARTEGALAFLFTGQGAQAAGMGRGLYELWTVFREALDRCVELFDAELEQPLKAVMWAGAGDAEEGLLDQTAYTQPALFSLEYALSKLWRSWGVKPALVAGHSIGEIVAACVAGVFSLEDAVSVVAARGRLMQALPAGGAMVSIAASEAEVSAAMLGREAELSIAAVNGPAQVVIAGLERTVEEVAAEFAERGVPTKRLVVSHAFHSPLMDPLLDEFRRVAERVRYARPTIPILSNVTGKLAGEEIGTPEYWVAQVRSTVRFADGIRALHEAGARTYIEIGPGGTLVSAVPACVPEASPQLLASLRRGRDETTGVLEALAGWWSAGGKVDWAEVFSAGGRRVPLPTYPWQRERCWHDLPAPSNTAAGAPVTSAYYDALAHEGSPDGSEKYLTFGPFREVVPGFSWLLFFENPKAHEEYAQLALKAQRELRAVLFRHVDFSNCKTVFDFGCGYATDLITLAQKYPHLQVEGYTISAEQANLGGERARQAHVGDRAGIYHRDSAKSPFPRKYDLVFGFEVAHHVRDKGALFANIGDHLTEGGLLVLADFKSNTGSDIEHEKSSSYFIIREQWVELLSQNQLKVLDCVDVSQEIANFLYDPNFDGNLERLSPRNPDENVRTAFTSYDRLGKLLRGGLASYILLTAQKVRDIEPEELKRINRQALDEMLPYAYFDGRGTLRPEEDNWFLELAWETAALPASQQPMAGRWLLLGGGELGAALGRVLEGVGQRAVHVAAVPSRVTEMSALLAQSLGGQAPTAVVHLGSLEGGTSFDTASVEAALVCGPDSVLCTVQAVAAMGYRDPPRLWLVTRGAQPVGVGVVAVAQAALLGLARTIAHEHPDLRCIRVDLDPARPEGEVEALVSELLADDGEDEVAWRASERRVARLVRRAPDAGRGERLEPAGERPFGLEIDEPGVLDRLVLRAMNPRQPGPGEVEIAVEAAGLNFRDVLLALGVMPNAVPGATDRPMLLGGECAGHIVAVGEGVSGFALGQPVVALTRGAFASRVITHANLVLPKPAKLSAVEAAAVPVAYLTAWYALAKVARLERGERVLIHAATGGVGLAAVQWAQHVGAEIYATAGSVEKRAYLASLGVRYVSDSRSDQFVNDVLEWTKGQGVDVVLNSLSGELIANSFGLLRSHGRFVEIGKRDDHADRQLGLRPFLRNFSFALVDLGAMLVERPDWVRDLLAELLLVFDAGVFTLPPIETFPMSRATEAFAKMAHAKHVGKLVLVPAEPEARVLAPAAKVLVRSESSYLVTGGLGGLGLSVAGWLAEQGAGHLVLVGRSGVVTAEQQAAVAALRAKGARVTVAEADVANRAALEQVLADIRTTGMPLSGVVHAAGLLDDGLLLQQTPERLRKVMAPKVWGAVHLDELTRGEALDFFVLYASGAGLLGSPGQGNYAAANSFLDALAQRRRAHGLPGLSIDWGAFSELGLAAGKENRGVRLASLGMRSLTPAEGLSVLARLLDGDRAQVAVIPLDAHQWLESHPTAASSRMLSRLISGPRVQSKGDPALLERLAAAEPEMRAELLIECIRELVSKVLRIPEAKLDVLAPLSGLGMDSLMGLELRNRIEDLLGIKVPATLLWTYPTVTALGLELAGQANFARRDGRRWEPVKSSAAEDDNGAAQLDEQGLLALLEESLARAGKDVVT